VFTGYRVTLSQNELQPELAQRASMSEPNPYGTPSARVEDLPEPVNRPFRWKAVLIGAATDIVGSAIAGIVLVIAFSVLDGPGGAPEDVLAWLGQSWPFLMISMIVGGGFTVLGGYVAGRIARHSFLKHALAAGGLSLVIGMVLFHSEDGPYSGIVSTLGYGLHLPLALLGGWLAWRRLSSR
jgi:VIT1/CCC1 family predicted Fe2+/Mn2+ transporter